MTQAAMEEFIDSTKKAVLDSFPLSDMEDTELHDAIEELVADKLNGQYIPLHQRAGIVEAIYSSIRGLGLLDTIMADDSITEVMINGPDCIFVEQNGRVHRLDQAFESEKRLRDIIQRIVGKAGRAVDEAHPIVDTRLQNGDRVNVVLRPISLTGPIVTIRKFSKKPMTIEKLIEYGSITKEIAAFLELLVRAKYNIFISGGTGSGKTTFLNALSNYIDNYLRINFDSLIKLVDAIGGVDVYSEYEFSGRGCTFDQGINHLDGEEALVFARERYAFTEGDNQRGKNQMAVIQAIIDKLQSPAILKNSAEVLSVVEECMQTDFSFEEISEMISWQLEKGAEWNVEQQAVYGSGDMQETYSMKGMTLYVMWPDEQSVSEAAAKIKEVKEMKADQ